ncbi:hypothetical protein [Marinivivus vitaminiproducens]|nr:hypothetical protein P4R82_10185 [Geminicoccaceae bacterium SCSIO 64248]
MAAIAAASPIGYVSQNPGVEPLCGSHRMLTLVANMRRLIWLERQAVSG